MKGAAAMVILRNTGLFLILAVAVLWGIAQLMTANNKVRHSGYTASVYGEEVHYLDSADLGINPDGTPVLLLHGSSGNLWDMEYRLSAALQARGFRTISVDRPGLGSSSRNDPALRDPRMQAGLMDGFLDALGVEQAVVLGHSLGNTVVMGMAMNYPDRVIAAVDVAGVSHTWLGEPWILYQFVDWPVFGFIWTDILLPLVGPIILNGMAEATFAPDPMPENFIFDGGVNHILHPKSFRANADDNNSLRYMMVDMYSDYDKIDVPFLLAWGEGEYVQSPTDDHTGVAVPWWNHGARLVNILPDTEVVVAEGVGHMMQHFGGDVIADALVSFLDRRGLGQN